MLKVAINPKNSSNIYAICNNYWAGTVMISNDGGKRWTSSITMTDDPTKDMLAEVAQSGAMDRIAMAWIVSTHRSTASRPRTPATMPHVWLCRKTPSHCLGVRYGRSPAPATPSPG